LELIRLRATVLRQIREFFYAQQVMEVETPVLGECVGTDPYLDYFTTHYSSAKKSFYMQSSPEFAMKRLLAAQSGSIYQISKAFRNGESGRYHNPEFTILEWYRIGFNLQQLMDDIELLFSQLLPVASFSVPAERVSYVDIFAKHLELDALVFDRLKYQSVAVNYGFPEAQQLCATDHAAWLDFLFSHIIQKQMVGQGVHMVYDYPACLPSLARLKPDNALIAERVEVFIDGMEIGNGFFELADEHEQSMRFTEDIKVRHTNGAAFIAKDQRFLAALQHGLPDCAGVAIGIDRLLMVIGQQSHINDVLAFPIEIA
jgi:lysyl-tRNA synthetase class 2